MATVLDIYNSALVKLGCKVLVAENDGSKESLLCATRYESCRDYVLREYPWKCAIKRVALAPLSTQPLSIPCNLRQWQYQVQLPSDYLRLVLDDDDKLHFQIEGSTFLTNQEAPVIKYVWKVDPPTILNPHLTECIAWYLAQDIALAIVQNTLISDRMSKQYLAFLSKAKFIDASTTRAITQDEYFYENARLQANHI